MNPLNNNLENKTKQINKKDIELNESTLFSTNRASTSLYIESNFDLLVLNDEELEYPVSDTTLLENLKDYENVLNLLHFAAIINPNYYYFENSIVKRYFYYIYYYSCRISYVYSIVYYCNALITSIILGTFNVNISLPILIYIFCFLFYSMYNLRYLQNKILENVLLINIPYFSENVNVIYSFIFGSICCAMPNLLLKLTNTTG